MKFLREFFEGFVDAVNVDCNVMFTVSSGREVQTAWNRCSQFCVEGTGQEMDGSWGGRTCGEVPSCGDMVLWPAAPTH